MYAGTHRHTQTQTQTHTLQTHMHTHTCMLGSYEHKCTNKYIYTHRHMYLHLLMETMEFMLTHVALYIPKLALAIIWAWLLTAKLRNFEFSHHRLFSPRRFRRSITHTWPRVVLSSIAWPDHRYDYQITHFYRVSLKCPLHYHSFKSASRWLTWFNTRLWKKIATSIATFVELPGLWYVVFVNSDYQALLCTDNGLRLWLRARVLVHVETE